jgi:hypothetical protein
LRFSNHQVLYESEWVISQIRALLGPNPHPGPLPQGEGEASYGPISPLRNKEGR